MKDVRAKKHLGQHFLIDDSVTERIASSFKEVFPKGKILEVGPGMGVLTEYFLDDEKYELTVSEIDTESILYLKSVLNLSDSQIIEGDFLKKNLEETLEKIYKERKDTYADANYRIDCEKLNIKSITNKIIKIYANH